MIFTLQRFFNIRRRVIKTSSFDLAVLNIPRLQEVLESEEVPANLNIEIKSQSAFVRRQVMALKKLLDSIEIQKNIMVSSFNPLVLFWAKRFLPKVPRALIVGEARIVEGSGFPFFVRIASPHYINTHYSIMDKERSRKRLLSVEKPLMVWTVNDTEKAKFYLKKGVKSIISDWPSDRK